MQPAFNELDKKVLAFLLSLALTMATVPGDVSQAQEQQGASEPFSSGYSGQGAPQTPEELQSLVAPIALYPDALVAQILGAATFPDQMLLALEQAVNQQSWDPSVKALTQFPSVLNNLAQNLNWTSRFSASITLSVSLAARPTLAPTYPIGPNIGDGRKHSSKT